MVYRLGAGDGTEHGLSAAAATEGDAEEVVEALADLAVGQTGLFVQFDDGGLDVRSELGGGGAEGVGSLQRMASLDAAQALAAVTDVDVELPVNGASGNLNLKLVSDLRFLERAAAVGAGFWERRLVDFVDLLGGWRLAMGLGAVVVAGFAAGFLGFGLGRFLGEGRRLPFAGTERFLELPAQGLVIGLEFSHLLLKCRASRTEDRFPTVIIRSPLSCSCTICTLARLGYAKQIRS